MSRQPGIYVTTLDGGYDVVRIGSDCVQRYLTSSIESAADTAVEWSGDTGLPVFWDGRPYLTECVAEVPR